MSEWLFPIGGALIAFLVAVPLLTSIARIVLTTMPAAVEGTSAHLDGWRFLLIVAPSLGTWTWLLSASIHQATADTDFTACLLDHFDGDLLRDEIFFGLLLCSILAASALRRLRPSNHDKRPRTRKHLQGSAEAKARVLGVCRKSSSLIGAEKRVRIVQQGLAPACTRGLFRPFVEMEESLVAQLSDDELAAALLHEWEHVQGLDPLRFLGAQVALSINPLARWLEPELARYRFARELHCDRRAVQCGANPLALAQSIVLAAMPAPASDNAVALGGPGLASVRMRVQLLLGYATQSPEAMHAAAPPEPTFSLVMAMLLCPHVLGSGPLDVLHTSIERAALLFGWG